jgi:hypothetical protein
MFRVSQFERQDRMAGGDKNYRCLIIARPAGYNTPATQSSAGVKT